MGWNSAGDIFDPVAAMVIKSVEGKAIAEWDARQLLSTLIGKLQEMDWDTECESLEDFAGHPFVVAAFADNGVELDEVVEPDLAVAKRAILDFDWHNYGLDNVGDTAADDWAQALAEAVLASQG